jgi:hypothetical protein
VQHELIDYEYSIQQNASIATERIRESLNAASMSLFQKEAGQGNPVRAGGQEASVKIPRSPI